MRLRIEQPALRVQVRRRRFEPDGSSTKAQRRSDRSQGLRRLGLRGDSDATQQRRAGESTIAAGESSANIFESGAGVLDTLCFERGAFSVGNVCRGGAGLASVAGAGWLATW